LERQGQVGRQELLEVDVVTPEPDIVERLGLTDEDPVLVRRRLLYANDEPVQISDSYYPYRLVEGTPLAGRAKVLAGSLKTLQQAGVQLRHVAEDIAVRMPRPEEARLLKLATGVPVIRFLRTLSDANGVAVEVSEIICAGDRHILHYEFELS
jgi:GntR family transcriptional regulator